MTDHALSMEADTFDQVHTSGTYMETLPTGTGIASCLCGWQSKRDTPEDAASFREQGQAHIEPYLESRLERSHNTDSQWMRHDGTDWREIEPRTEWALAYDWTDGSTGYISCDSPEEVQRLIADERPGSVTAARMRPVRRRVWEEPWREVES